MIIPEELRMHMNSYLFRNTGSTFNFSYPDEAVVRDILRAAGTTGIGTPESVSKVLTRLYPKIFPEGFFDRENVDISYFTRTVTDWSRDGVIAVYENKFGWGEKGQFSRPLSDSSPPEFSEHDLTVRLETVDTVFLPPISEEFIKGHLCSLIFGEKTEEVRRANPNALPFFYAYIKQGLKADATLGMSLRNPAYSCLPAPIDLLKEVLGVLQGADQQFREYVGIIAAEYGIGETNKRLRGIHSAYANAIKASGREDAETEAKVRDAEKASLSSLAGIASQLPIQREQLLNDITVMFERNTLRNRVAAYFTGETPYPIVKPKKRTSSLEDDFDY